MNSPLVRFNSIRVLITFTMLLLVPYNLYADSLIEPKATTLGRIVSLNNRGVAFVAGCSGGESKKYHIPPNLVVRSFRRALIPSRGQDLQVEHPVGCGYSPICIKVSYLPYNHDFRLRERSPYSTHSP